MIFSVISIILFAVLFAPSSLFQQAFSMMGIVFDGGSAQSKDAKSEMESSEIQSNSIDEDPIIKMKDTDVDDHEDTSVSSKVYVIELP